LTRAKLPCWRLSSCWRTDEPRRALKLSRDRLAEIPDLVFSAERRDRSIAATVISVWFRTEIGRRQPHKSRSRSRGTIRSLDLSIRSMSEHWFGAAPGGLSPTREQCSGRSGAAPLACICRLSACDLTTGQMRGRRRNDHGVRWLTHHNTTTDTWSGS
jgi:hypothetical protein